MNHHIWIAPLLTVLAGAATASPWTLSQVIDSLSTRYDRIESYRADADIFEFDG